MGGSTLSNTAILASSTCSTALTDDDIKRFTGSNCDVVLVCKPPAPAATAGVTPRPRRRCCAASATSDRNYADAGDARRHHPVVRTYVKLNLSRRCRSRPAFSCSKHYCSLRRVVEADCRTVPIGTVREETEYVHAARRRSKRRRGAARPLHGAPRDCEAASTASAVHDE